MFANKKPRCAEGGKDRRQRPRINLAQPALARLRSGSREIEGEVPDISTQGAKFLCPLPAPAIGKEVEIDIFLPTGLLSLAGQATPRGPGNFGIEFAFRHDEQQKVRTVVEALLNNESCDQGSTVTVRGTTMHIRGAFDIAARRDFASAVACFGVREIDLSGVSSVTLTAAAMCFLATEQKGVKVVRCSRPAFEILSGVGYCRLCGQEATCNRRFGPAVGAPAFAGNR